MTETVDYIKDHYVLFLLIGAILGMIVYAFVTAPMVADDYDSDYPLPPKVDYCDCKIQSISNLNLYKCANCNKLINPEE